MLHSYEPSKIKTFASKQNEYKVKDAGGWMVHRLYVQVYMMVNSMWGTGRLSMERGS